MNGGFTDRVKKVILLAREEALRLRNSYVDVEHIILGLLREKEGVAAQVLTNLNVDLDRLRELIEDTLPMSSGGYTVGNLPYTPRARKILDIAKNEAKALQHSYIGTEHLLLAILRERDSASTHALLSMGISYQNVYDEIVKFLNLKSENPMQPTKEKIPTLEHFSRDLTQLAENGELDPVIGREREIERVMQVLNRRKKNNPVLLGEPGVGKTAIVEGLAQRIVKGDVPENLKNVRLLALDLALMVAGTKYRGQFEERLKNVMAEIRKAKDIIVFIDEVHTIVGAGGAEGALDASNMLKPALSRGEMQCIGSTTLDEYKKSIEKDGALERRFQTIIVDPPSVEETIKILEGLRAKYEEHHNVKITNAALDGAARLSDRYITHRFLPDKAIDVIDEAGSRAKMRALSVPEIIKELELESDQLEKRKKIVADAHEFEKAIQLRDDIQKIRVQIREERAKWEAVSRETEVIVDFEQIADTVSSITGIPMTRIEEEESKKLLRMEEELHQRIVNQDEAISLVSKAIRRNRVGIGDPNRPIASFLFLGPTGVGKTELARTLAAFMFDDPNSLIRLDMSEYMEKFAVSRMIGAPPGYVGYEEGGQLTEKVRRRPYSVVLLDEIEKAHPEVFNILLQILDNGVLTDSFGRKVDFKNCVIIMTSNIGARRITDGGVTVGFQRTEEANRYEVIKDRVMQEVKKTFNPEFLNRLDEAIVFHPLTYEDIKQIIDILMRDVQNRLVDQGIILELSIEARDLLAESGYSPEYGARPLKRAIRSMVEDPLAELILKGGLSNRLIKVNREGDKFSFESEVKLDQMVSQDVVT